MSNKGDKRLYGSCKSGQEDGKHEQSKNSYSKSRSVRNLLIICVCYLLFFSGFWGLSNLQSTMNAEEGMGMYSQAVIYFCSMLSCFLPAVLVQRFGSKSTFQVALLLSCSYLAANIQLRWDSFMSVSAIYGLASGPLNAAYAGYIDEMAMRYSSVSGMSREAVESIFFGIALVFSELCSVFGNLISYFILEGHNDSTFLNQSTNYNCGVHFQADEDMGVNGNLTPPPDSQRHWLVGIYIALGLTAVVFASFLDPLRNDIKSSGGCESVSSQIFSAAKHLRNPRQVLLILLSVFCGMEGPFYLGEFTQAFVACSWGIHHVGFVSICFGAFGALTSVIVGPFVKITSLKFVIVVASLLSLLSYAALFAWTPSPDAPTLYFVFSALFGTTDAIWWSQMLALYGVTFPEEREAAYSNFYFWNYVGSTVSYGYANYLSTVTKLYILFAVLILGTISYLLTGIWRKRSAVSPIAP